MKNHYTGLSDSEVSASRNKYGSNIITPKEKKSRWKLFLAKFKDPLIMILMAAGIMSVAISCYEYWGLNQGFGVFFEPIGIFAAIILATGLGFVFEQKAEREFEVLNKVNDAEQVEVVRQSNVTTVPKSHIVVGDIVLLSTGQEIPADGVLLESTLLSVDESTLTGEPVSSKSADPADANPSATYPADSVMRGTKVMDGYGVMRVTHVGDSTEAGKVFRAVQLDDNVVTPLDEQLSRLGRFITICSYAVAALVIVGRVTMYILSGSSLGSLSFVSYMLQTLMLAVTLVVVSVPEGLPMAVTLALAYSMRRMLRTNNLVRRLHACETMGATTVICTDKTGTLTQNRMEVSQMYTFGDADIALIDSSIAINSTSNLDISGDKVSAVGNPTEGALLLWLHGRGIDIAALRQKNEIVAELPFNTERKYMATAARSGDGRTLLYVKGAPEIILSMCAMQENAEKAKALHLLRQCQERGMRTIAMAYAAVGIPDDIGNIASGFIPPLHLLAVAAIADPVRRDVPEAVKEVTDAGINIKIVTGDTAATAAAIARQIGLDSGSKPLSSRNIVTGQEIAAMSDAELRRRAPEMTIISRARPMDKKRLVEALQYDGEVVAVTGDGTNDAPALHTAHVGLSMGDGTAVAKEASDITIIDNSFASIGRAVMWGRSLYRNIQRFILFQLTVNVVACIVVLAGAFMGMDAPLTVTQMLWVNLIMDTFAAMALASLPPTQAVMHDKPRSRTDFIISRGMGVLIAVSGCIFAALLLLLLYRLEHGTATSFIGLISSIFSHSGNVSAGSASHSLTGYESSVFFTTFVFIQFWNMFNVRAYATGQSAFRLHDCGEFVFVAAVILVGQIAIVSLGGPFFGVSPLSVGDWVAIALATSPVLLIGELIRAVRR